MFIVQLKKKNCWLKNVTILGTVSVQFRNECHGQRFILFPSSLCTFSHRLTNKCHKEGSKHFAEMPTWISGHTVFTISCRDISLSFMISTKTTCIWLLNPLRFIFFRTWILNFFYDRFFKWSMQRIWLGKIFYIFTSNRRLWKCCIFFDCSI